MKNLILFFGLMIGSFVMIDAQPPGRNPAPPPAATEQTTLQRNQSNQQDINNRSKNLQMSEEFPVGEDEAKIVQRFIRPLYREPSKEEQKLLSPNNEDTEKFAEFLRQKNTGLIKLIADKGCDKGTEVVVSTPHCTTYAMPGSGASFSFRINNYRSRTLSDLTFTGKTFQSLGTFIHGILVNIGDVPLEKVDLQNEAVNYLVNFEPASDMEKAQKIADQLKKGIENNGLSYRSVLPAVENATYILRSIAYNSVLPRTVKGITYNELEFDKRKDMTVAFRIARREGEENVTILWKELTNKKPPKLATSEKKD